ncbi:MAG: DUF1698 domain-containing protein [Acetobacteraceae bacterium]|nr:DUF1698 domain-containing protein [Acetobacteraceae bacterium]
MTDSSEVISPSIGSFTAHNILLPDGSRTIPDKSDLLADHGPMQAARRVLDLLFPYGPKQRSIADLGCLEGGYTLEFARLGMRALGIEVRQSNFENCMAIKEAFPHLRNLNFIKDDVWNIRNYGKFDTIFCCGLLYHLDRPMEFIRLLGETSRYAIIVNTHIAISSKDASERLSDMTENEGVPGRWFHEYDPDSTDPAALEQKNWQSWANYRSFWPSAPALLNAMQYAGFDLLFEQADWLSPDIPGSMTGSLYASWGRRTFVGIRTKMSGRGLLGSLLARAHQIRPRSVHFRSAKTARVTPSRTPKSPK